MIASSILPTDELANQVKKDKQTRSQKRIKEGGEHGEIKDRFNSGSDSDGGGSSEKQPHLPKKDIQAEKSQDILIRILEISKII